MSRKAKSTLVVAAACALAAGLAVLSSCGRGEDSARFADHAIEAHKELSDARAELARCRAELASSNEKLAAAERRADLLARQLEQERLQGSTAMARAESSETDLYLAGAIAFSAVAAALLLVALLLREHSAHRALSVLLGWLRRRKSI